jgi:hypothetical protein
MAGKSPFDYINNISQSKSSIWDDDSDREYSAFMVNRGLSQYADTIMFAQIMNTYGSYVSNRAQYDFYRYGITNKKKRFAKWSKAKKHEDLLEYASHFGLSTDLFEKNLELMTDEQISEMKSMFEKGGRR